MAPNSQSNGVVCTRCKTPIRIEKAERVAEEFSVACPHCGFRAFYHIKDIRPLERA